MGREQEPEDGEGDVEENQQQPDADPHSGASVRWRPVE
jgi:hypothetical protein